MVWVNLPFRLNHKWFSTTTANIVRFDVWGDISLLCKKKMSVTSLLVLFLFYANICTKILWVRWVHDIRNWFQQDEVIVKSISEASLYFQMQYKSSFWNMFSEELNAIWMFKLEPSSTASSVETIKRAYPVQRTPALCGVWGRVSVASLTLACAMRGDCDSNPGPSGHRR